MPPLRTVTLSLALLALLAGCGQDAATTPPPAGSAGSAGSGTQWGQEAGGPPESLERKGQRLEEATRQPGATSAPAPRPPEDTSLMDTQREMMERQLEIIEQTR